jgi:hypothetical protein
MKSLFCSKTIIIFLAVAMAAAAGTISPAQDQPMPPLAGDSALPASIVPGSPLAQVVKMLQAGVDAGTIKSYILNSQSAFNLDADQILFLKDEGAPSDLINAMLERDKALYAATIVPAPAPAPATVSTDTAAPDTAPPPTEVTDNYFDDTLAPYGSWVDVEGYGRCWRPTAVIYDSAWRPYGDRGHWVYTDYGWYWDSDYSWGLTFHYGRWFHHARFGWCWYPDTQWAPSWVTWRSGGDYCGWAPLPPLAEFRPGIGFFYRGARVAMDFDFGLGADSFMFVSPEHFCDRRPRNFFIEPQHAALIYRQTKVINNFSVNSRTIENRGIAVEHITSATHRTIAPVHVGSLPNAGRQGWRGENFNRPQPHAAADNNAGRNFANGNNQFNHDAAPHNNPINNANVNHGQNFGQPFNPPTQPNQKSEANNNGQSVYRNQSQTRNDPPVTGNGHFQTTQPMVPGVKPVITEHAPVQNTQPPGGYKNTVPAQNEFRQNHIAEPPRANVPQQHFGAQPESHPFVAPSVPNVPSQPVAPRNFNPPPPAPAPAATAPHNAGTGSDKDKQNH